MNTFCTHYFLEISFEYILFTFISREKFRTILYTLLFGSKFWTQLVHNNFPEKSFKHIVYTLLSGSKFWIYLLQKNFLEVSLEHVLYALLSGKFLTRVSHIPFESKFWSDLVHIIPECNSRTYFEYNTFWK